MWDCSSYHDPVSANGDREKPEVVAPGATITSTSINNGLNTESGTSLAAPHVTGAAALLVHKSQSLEAWPEEIIAILMASAIHDIDIPGDDPNVPLHDKDGVGGIDIASAMQVIDDGLNSHHVFTEESFPYDESFAVTQGQKVRAVIRWDSQAYLTDPNNHLSTVVDTLEADLDLLVYDPNNQLVTSSCSYDNNYEIVGFTASTTGNYRIRITQKQFDGSEEYVGIAICKY